MSRVSLASSWENRVLSSALDHGETGLFQPKHFVGFDVQVFAVVGRVFCLVLSHGLDGDQGRVATANLENPDRFFQADQVVCTGTCIRASLQKGILPTPNRPFS